MKIQVVAACAALCVAMSGCASIIEGTTQNVAVTTPSAEGAKCKLQNSEGTWYLTTPGNTKVHKTKHALDISCTKDGFEDASTKVEPHFNGATTGNILAGGLIGIGVDAATGANYNYPNEVSILMNPKDPAPTPAADTTPAPASDQQPPADAPKPLT